MVKKKQVKKKVAKKVTMINVERLEELKSKLVKFFQRENVTIFESRLVMNEILKELDDEVQANIFSSVLEAEE